MATLTRDKPSRWARIRSSLSRMDWDRLYAFGAILPSVILLGIFVYGFIGETVYWSLTSWRGVELNPTKAYIGIQNYKDLFTAFGSIEPKFRLGIVNTFFFTAFFLVGCLTLGFLLAVLLDQNIKSEGIFRTIFLFPMALSFAVTGTIWRWLFNPGGGINALPTVVGADPLTFKWLNNRSAFTFNWHEVPWPITAIIMLGLLAYFAMQVSRRNYLKAIFFGVPMVLIFAWVAADFATWDPARKDELMHGLFQWSTMLDVIAAVIVILFCLGTIQALWHSSRTAIWLGVPTMLLVLWYFTGGPDSLPKLDIPEAESPYGFNMALIALIIAAVWQLSGYTMAMYLAGIRGVSDELREAARVDGCNEVQVYTKIILPLLRPITLSAAIVLGHISLKIFDLIFAMVGPDFLPTTVPGVQVYSMFRSNEFAKGSAIAVVLLMMVAIIIIPYLATQLRGEHEV